jgi:hypothetical protein
VGFFDGFDIDPQSIVDFGQDFTLPKFPWKRVKIDPNRGMGEILFFPGQIVLSNILDITQLS